MSEDNELLRIVEEELRWALANGTDAPSSKGTGLQGPAKRTPYLARWLRDDQEPPWKKPTPTKSLSDPRPNSDGKGQPEIQTHIARPSNPTVLKNLVRNTPSRLGVGRTGVRYLTQIYLKMRADHAIAKDAVQSQLEDEFITRLNLLPLQSLCEDKQDYLLHPARGRRLREESISTLSQHGTQGVDVQIIVGDGLSAWAVERNTPELLPHLQSSLTAAGFGLGQPLFVRFARVGVQDHIGVLTGAKSTVILVGERPGLGTGDSLSVYLAHAPRLDQDNAEKRCISNIRPGGIKPHEAAMQSANILKQASRQDNAK